MTKRKVYIVLILIIGLAFLSANLIYPKYINKGIDFLDSRFHLKLPHFWEKPFKLGLDLQGGTHLVYEADLSSIEKGDYSSAMEGLRDVIERRVNLFGVAEPIVQVQETAGHHRLVVELAGIKDVGEAIKMIGQTPYLEFKEQRTEEETQKILDKKKELEGKTPEEIQNIPDWQIAYDDPYFKPTSLTGRYLKKAKLGFDQNTGTPLVSIEFDDEGSKIFEELTSKNIKKPLAIYIDQMPISVPIVQDVISGGKAQISGEFTVDKAKELARNLNAGALPVPINLISQQTVGPTLGKISLEKSLKAGVIGFLTVVLFMIILYRLPGVLASLALGIYLSLVLTLFKMIPVTLTLAGIGGFILSIGMAVDANILIFARMREELKEKKDIIFSTEEGIRRAWPSIRDSNLNTILVCLVFLVFGTSFVQGFAFALTLGVVVSMFSAIIITNYFLKFCANTKLGKINWLWR